MKKYKKIWHGYRGKNHPLNKKRKKERKTGKKQIRMRKFVEVVSKIIRTRKRMEYLMGVETAFKLAVKIENKKGGNIKKMHHS